MNSLEKEATKYLKSKKEYSNLMEALKEKYKKTGKLTGKVKLQSITTEEGLLLGAIDSSLFGAKDGSLSIKKFIDFFSIGRFEGVDFIIVLKEYFGVENLKTYKEVKVEKSLIKEEFFINIFNKIKNPEIKLWLNAVIDYKKYGYHGIVRAYGENPKMLKEVLLNIDKSFDFIRLGSDEYIPLAKFASLVTKDSHYFDMDNFPGKLFIAAIGYLYNINIDKAESKNEALMKVNIIRDEISNFTITYGLMAYDEKEEIMGYKWFRREGQPLLLNIYNLNSIKEIKAAHNKVYVFENPTVFYELLRKTKDMKITLVCTSGQPNVSCLMLLDKLTEGGATIYYSGDFDPEGLQIASNLKFRYKKALKFFGMTSENYLKIKGDNSFAERVGKLNIIADKELAELVVQMKTYCTAGYQELLIDYYHNLIR